MEIGGKAKILVIDDEQGIRDMLTFELGQQGYEIITAQNGKEGLKKVNEEKSDVVISDIKMPEMDGIAVLEEIKKIDPEIEVIMATGFATMETAIQSLRFGAFDFISKPFSVEEMQHTIKNAANSCRLKRQVAALNENLKKANAELKKLNSSLEAKIQERTKELDESREKLKEDYEKLKKLDIMKSDFISTVSHELRTPLTPIMGCADMLSDGAYGALSPEQVKPINTIKEQSNHLLHLINSMLAIAQIEGGKLILKKSAVSLCETICAALEGLRKDYEKKKIEFIFERGDDIPTIIADENETDRVVTNILGNAHKFTPTGGKVEVSVLPSNDSVAVRIKDDGIGVAKENLEKIFGQFYQIDNSITRAEEGMGVGLYIAKMIVDAHDGKIWAESDGLGHGMSIVFTLPIEGKIKG